eukprot:CAMPEP_0198682290 /NCGR_PEP_ID=MMETSP1468-20131203/8440_1 /TAXON_ID=1461545 /ORGANISM="Mantoniella sp, Strain CCMP1436" /LENGTH=54 /DNA_ID=CAMNT_0044425061 /DNA_START=376 /DNA_END=540 /DNA_ORIENTATION=-
MAPALPAMVLFSTLMLVRLRKAAHACSCTNALSVCPSNAATTAQTASTFCALVM